MYLIVKDDVNFNKKLLKRCREEDYTCIKNSPIYDWLNSYCAMVVLDCVTVSVWCVGPHKVSSLSRRGLHQVLPTVCVPFCNRVLAASYSRGPYYTWLDSRHTVINSYSGPLSQHHRSHKPPLKRLTLHVGQSKKTGSQTAWSSINMHQNKHLYTLNTVVHMEHDSVPHVVQPHMLYLHLCSL